MTLTGRVEVNGRQQTISERVTSENVRTFRHDETLLLSTYFIIKRLGRGDKFTRHRHEKTKSQLEYPERIFQDIKYHFILILRLILLILLLSHK